MGNVPSSVLYAIFTTILVCLVFALFLYAVRQQPELQKAGDAKQEQMNQVNSSDDYLQYAGSTMRGDEVRTVIKGLRKTNLIARINTGSSIVVFNCDAKTYGYRLSDASGSEGTYKEQTNNFNEAWQNTGNIQKKYWYVEPLGTYTCTVIQDTSGAVTEIDFTKG